MAYARIARICDVAAEVCGAAHAAVYRAYAIRPYNSRISFFVCAHNIFKATASVASHDNPRPAVIVTALLRIPPP